MSLLNDIDGDGSLELAVSAPGQDLWANTNLGQIYSFSFNTFWEVDLPESILADFHSVKSDLSEIFSLP